jgi:hypothetical protein
VKQQFRFESWVLWHFYSAPQREIIVARPPIFHRPEFPKLQGEKHRGYNARPGNKSHAEKDLWGQKRDINDPNELLK